MPVFKILPFCSSILSPNPFIHHYYTVFHPQKHTNFAFPLIPLQIVCSLLQPKYLYQMSQPPQEIHKTKKIKKGSKSAATKLQKVDGSQVQGSNMQCENQPENSLSFLTQKFLEFAKESSNCCLNIQKLAIALNVSKRRVYDITNVLSAIGIINKSKKNEVTWRPDLPIFSKNYKPRETETEKKTLTLDEEEKSVLNLFKDYEDGKLTNEHIDIVKQSLNCLQVEEFAKFGEEIEKFLNDDPFETYSKARKSIQNGQSVKKEQKNEKVLISQFLKLGDKTFQRQETSKVMKRANKKKSLTVQESQSSKNEFLKLKKEQERKSAKEDFRNLQILIADEYFQKLVHFVP